MKLEEEVGELLKAKGMRIAIAESTAGGYISYRLLSVSGASRYFDRGVVAYSRKAKVDTLQVSAELIDKFGSVSVETAAAMAEGARKISGADIGIGETGIAGPIQGRSSKPVGTICIALSTPEGTDSGEFVFDGDRLKVMEGISTKALEMVVAYLKK